MKNLKTGILALILTTLFYSTVVAQTSANSINTSYYELAKQKSNVYGKVINSDVNKESINIKLLKHVDSLWIVEQNVYSDRYNFSLDRDSEYQIVFNNGVKVKTIGIHSGYTGSYVYRIDANFTNERSIVMYPNPDNSDSFHIEFLDASDPNNDLN